MLKRSRNLAVGRPSQWKIWNERTLRPNGNLNGLTDANDRYHWNIRSLCEMQRKKNFFEMTIEEGHTVYYIYSEQEGRHEHRTCFFCT